MKEQPGTIHQPRTGAHSLVKVMHAPCQRRYAEYHLFRGSNAAGNAPNFHSFYRRYAPAESFISLGVGGAPDF